MGSPLTNKYAEGLPGKRYYGGCEVVDKVEQLAIDRAKQLFGAEHANVQPHSGAQANYAAMTAFLKPGDTFLGMDLSNGGHLTHGSPVNFSGMLYQGGLVRRHRRRAASTTTTCARKAREHRPKLVLAGYSAYSRVVDFAAFAEVAREIGAIFMVDMAHFAGLVAGGVYPSPVPHADVVTTHDAQDAARSARRTDSLQGGARQGDRQVGVPGQPGRTARARHRREGRVLQGGARSVVQGILQRRSSPTRGRSRRRSSSADSRSCRAEPTIT